MVKASYLSAIFLISISMTGCGDERSSTINGVDINSDSTECSEAPTLGEWVSIPTASDNKLTFAANCIATSTYCESHFQYAKQIDEGLMAINVLDTNSKNSCPAVGTHVCEASIEANVLTLDCGVGSFRYSGL